MEQVVQARWDEELHGKFELVVESERLTCRAPSGPAALEAQGFPLSRKRFYQDNMSTIRFEKNGCKSCGPNSRHIDIVMALSRTDSSRTA
jgi:hypothetical protein